MLQKVVTNSAPQKTIYNTGTSGSYNKNFACFGTVFISWCTCTSYKLFSRKGWPGCSDLSRSHGRALCGCRALWSISLGGGHLSYPGLLPARYAIAYPVSSSCTKATCFFIGVLYATNGPCSTTASLLLSEVADHALRDGTIPCAALPTFCLRSGF